MHFYKLFVLGFGDSYGGGGEMKNFNLQISYGNKTDLKL